MNTRIYVGNIDVEGRSEALAQLFGRYGSVVTARIVRDAARSPNKGFGFVIMATEGEAHAAVAALSGYVHEGRALIVQEGAPKAQYEGETPSAGARVAPRGELMLRDEFHSACAPLKQKASQEEHNNTVETAKRESLEAWESEGGATKALPS